MRKPTYSNIALSLLGAALLSSITGVVRAEETASPAPSPLPPALAPEPSPPPDALEVERVDRELALFAARARAARLTLVVTGLVSGAALIPTGAVLSYRSDAVSQSVGTGMIVAGAVPLALAGLGLRTSRMEQLHAAFAERRAAGGDDAELLRLTESDWSSAAHDAQRSRPIQGGVELGIGVASAVTGLALLLAPAGFAGLDRAHQNEVGSALVGPGIPLTAVGLRTLLVESEEELSWAAHRAGRALGPMAMSAPTFGVSPVRGGAVAATSFVF
jgi:hypothetical protein